MIKGVILVLLLSGQTETYTAAEPFPDLASCGATTLDVMMTLKDVPEIVGVAFTCTL